MLDVLWLLPNLVSDKDLDYWLRAGIQWQNLVEKLTLIYHLSTTANSMNFIQYRNSINLKLLENSIDAWLMTQLAIFIIKQKVNALEMAV